VSTTVMAACWPLQMPPTQKAVLISLADNANDHGECWPSIPTIMARTCLGERTVHGAIKWLESVGALEADRSNGRHTRYTVTPEGFKPPQEMHPRSSRTPAASAVEPPQEMQKPPQQRQSPPQQLRSNRKEPSRTVKDKRAREITFDSWVKELGEQDAILANDPIFGWAKAAGISEDWLELAWLAFADRFTDNPKRYADWRAAFRNYVKQGWLNVWRALPDGTFVLTTVGEQFRRVRDSQQGAAA